MMQNLKNFIRHGKQARHLADQTDGEHARHAKHTHSDPSDHIRREPAAETKAPAPAQPQPIDSSKKTPSGQQGGDGFTSGMANQKYDENLLARLITEEKENKGKLPKYPGLERYKLLEKMGDGAFSNVYRALDTEGDQGEVAIKVVRKYELNASQVCSYPPSSLTFLCWAARTSTA